MPVKGYLVIKDYGGETSKVTFSLPDISAANWAGVTQDLDEIADGVADGGMIRGEVIEVGYTQSWARSTDAVTDEEAQRETKWLVGYTDICEWLDATSNLVHNPGFGKRFTMEIGTALLTGHMVDALSDDADLSETEVAALVDILEANVKSPYNCTALNSGPFIRVDYVKHVGRNT